MKLDNSFTLFTFEEVSKVVSGSSRGCIIQYDLPDLTLAEITEKFSKYRPNDESFWESVLEASGRDLQAEIDNCNAFERYLAGHGLRKSKGYKVVLDYLLFLQDNKIQQIKTEEQKLREKLRGGQVQLQKKDPFICQVDGVGMTYKGLLLFDYYLHSKRSRNLASLELSYNVTVMNLSKPSRELKDLGWQPKLSNQNSLKAFIQDLTRILDVFAKRKTSGSNPPSSDIVGVVQADLDRYQDLLEDLRT